MLFWRADQWAFYQSKGIKAAVQEASQTSWLAIGKEPPTKYGETQKRYVDEQAEIQKKAKEFEKKRDEKSTEADHLLHRHHGFANSVAILQVAIALGAVAALGRNKLIWLFSLLAGASGVALFAYTLLFFKLWS
jgi:hypothetical protein